MPLHHDTSDPEKEQMSGKAITYVFEDYNPGLSVPSPRDRLAAFLLWTIIIARTTTLATQNHQRKQWRNHSRDPLEPKRKKSLRL